MASSLLVQGDRNYVVIAITGPLGCGHGGARRARSAAEPGPGGTEARAQRAWLRGQVDELAWTQVAQLSISGLSSPITTSMGRLFDAAAALCGCRSQISYEGQAAIELEAACDPAERGSYPISVSDAGELIAIDPRETLRALLGEVEDGAALGVIASRFHTAIARATVHACALAASAQGTELIVLSGGVFQNRRLLEAVTAGLHARGLRVLVPERLPVNDGGISYGQAALAARRLALADGTLGG